MNYRSEKNRTLDLSLCQKAIKRVNFAYTSNLVRESKFEQSKMLTNERQTIISRGERVGASTAGLISNFNGKLDNLVGNKSERGKLI